MKLFARLEKTYESLFQKKALESKDKPFTQAEVKSLIPSKEEVYKNALEQITQLSATTTCGLATCFEESQKIAKKAIWDSTLLDRSYYKDLFKG